MKKIVSIGGKGITKRLCIGDEKILVQTMYKDSITDLFHNNSKLDKIIKYIFELEQLGCDILRFAVPDIESAKALCLIAQNTSMPLVADIHFDYRLALECLKGNVAKIRINPGNIGDFEKTKAVVESCKENGTAIRIGINSGSLPKDLQEQIEAGFITRAQGLCETASREAEIFDKLNFDQYVVSMKSSSVQETIDCNRFYASRFDNPLHLGVTEAGPLIGGLVKSTLAFSTLLNENIGDTIRVSLSSDCKNEVMSAVSILKECNKITGGVNIVSCPRCGRIGFDVHGFLDKWQDKLYSLNKDITIAVMGCVVNGPGEAKHADIGIAGGKDKVIIFKKGQIIHTLDYKDADNIFIKEIEKL